MKWKQREFSIQIIDSTHVLDKVLVNQAMKIKNSLIKRLKYLENINLIASHSSSKTYCERFVWNYFKWIFRVFFFLSKPSTFFFLFPSQYLSHFISKLFSPSTCLFFLIIFWLFVWSLLIWKKNSKIFVFIVFLNSSILLKHFICFIPCTLDFSTSCCARKFFEPFLRFFFHIFKVKQDNAQLFSFFSQLTFHNLFSFSPTQTSLRAVLHIIQRTSENVFIYTLIGFVYCFSLHCLQSHYFTSAFFSPRFHHTRSAFKVDNNFTLCAISFADSSLSI